MKSYAEKLSAEVGGYGTLAYTLVIITGSGFNAECMRCISHTACLYSTLLQSHAIHKNGEQQPGVKYALTN